MISSPSSGIFIFLLFILPDLVRATAPHITVTLTAPCCSVAALGGLLGGHSVALGGLWLLTLTLECGLGLDRGGALVDDDLQLGVGLAPHLALAVHI